QRRGGSLERIDEHVRAPQVGVAPGLETQPAPALPPSALVAPRSLDDQGHFLTFRLDNAADLARRLAKRGVDADVRGDRIRFGFGVYHDAADVDALIERLRSV